MSQLTSLVSLDALLIILLRRFPVAIKPGSTTFTYMALDQVSFGISFHAPTGNISASWCMLFSSSHNTASHVTSSNQHTIFSLSLSSSLRTCTISTNLNDSILSAKVSMPSHIMLMRPRQRGLLFVHHSGPWSTPLATLQKRSDYILTHLPISPSVQSNMHESTCSKQWFPLLIKMKISHTFLGGHRILAADTIFYLSMSTCDTQSLSKRPGHCWTTFSSMPPTFPPSSLYHLMVRSKYFNGHAYCCPMDRNADPYGATEKASQMHASPTT